jgi:anti-sigma regulatory factor (Ser/Thr protein kinase)
MKPLPGTRKTSARQMMKTYRATFPSTFEAVAEARRAVGRFAAACRLDPVAVSDIVLAAGEACNNAVEHGHVESGHFSVECAHEDGVLRIEVRDEGPGFEPALEQADAIAATFIGRGRGIAIMRALMDRVTYGSTGCGTSVKLEKRASSADRPRHAARATVAAGRSARGVGKAGGELGRTDAGHGS